MNNAGIDPGPDTFSYQGITNYILHFLILKNVWKSQNLHRNVDMLVAMIIGVADVISYSERANNVGEH